MDTAERAGLSLLGLPFLRKSRTQLGKDRYHHRHPGRTSALDSDLAEALAPEKVQYRDRARAGSFLAAVKQRRRQRLLSHRR